MTKLDNDTAIHILKSIAQGRLRPAGTSPSEVVGLPDPSMLEQNPGLRAALADAFGSLDKTQPSEGEVCCAD